MAPSRLKETGGYSRGYVRVHLLRSGSGGGGGLSTRWGWGTDAFEGKGPQRRPQKRLGRRLEEVAAAVGGGYCRLQMPLSLALGVRETAAGHRLGALERVGGGV